MPLPCRSSLLCRAEERRQSLAQPQSCTGTGSPHPKSTPVRHHVPGTIRRAGEQRGGRGKGHGGGRRTFPHLEGEERGETALKGARRTLRNRPRARAGEDEQRGHGRPACGNLPGGGVPAVQGRGGHIPGRRGGLALGRTMATTSHAGAAPAAAPLPGTRWPGCAWSTEPRPPPPGDTRKGKAPPPPAPQGRNPALHRHQPLGVPSAAPQTPQTPPSPSSGALTLLPKGCSLVTSSSTGCPKGFSAEPGSYMEKAWRSRRCGGAVPGGCPCSGRSLGAGAGCGGPVCCRICVFSDCSLWICSKAKEKLGGGGGGIGRDKGVYDGGPGGPAPTSRCSRRSSSLRLLFTFISCCTLASEAARAFFTSRYSCSVMGPSDRSEESMLCGERGSAPGSDPGRGALSGGEEEGGGCARGSPGHGCCGRRCAAAPGPCPRRRRRCRSRAGRPGRSGSAGRSRGRPWGSAGSSLAAGAWPPRGCR